MRVPVYKPLIDPTDLQAVSNVLNERWLGQGKYVKQFEEEIVSRLGNSKRRVVTVSNGTSGIHLALILAGVGYGDEVIVSSLNFVGVGQAILATGAKPIFCDVENATLVAGLENIERVLSPKTRVIIALDYASNQCNLDEILLYAGKKGNIE